MSTKRITIGAIAFAACLALGTIAAAAAVGSGGSTQPTFGGVPREAFRDDGTVDLSRVPDYISVSDRQGHEVGFVRREAALGVSGVQQVKSPAIVGRWEPHREPVYNASLVVVGHMVDGVGFVALGSDTGSPVVSIEE